MSEGKSLVMNGALGVGIIEFTNRDNEHGACAVVEGFAVTEEGVKLPGLTRLYVDREALDVLIQDLTDARAALDSGDYARFSEITQEYDTDE